jgi:hypothetical protein
VQPQGGANVPTTRCLQHYIRRCVSKPVRGSADHRFFTYFMAVSLNGVVEIYYLKFKPITAPRSYSAVAVVMNCHITESSGDVVRGFNSVN